VNLIGYNPHGQHAFEAPDPLAVERFQSYLLEKNLTAILRKSRGQDIDAACGQLGVCPGISGAISGAEARV
jgi:23S rRNA (adenine2503-C2)-methyltransferase